MKKYLVRYWGAFWGIPTVGARFQAIWDKEHRWGKWAIEILKDLPPSNEASVHRAVVGFLSPDAPDLTEGQFFHFWAGPNLVANVEVLAAEDQTK